MGVNNEVLLEKINLVVDKLLNLGKANYDEDAKNTSENITKGHIARDFGIEEWDWPQGVGLYGLLKLQNYHGDNRYEDFLDNWYKRNIERGLPSKNINTSAPYLALIDVLEITDNPIYEEMCMERAQWLMEELPRTKEGGFQHVTTAIGDRDGVLLHEEQVWIDTIFMAILFLNKMGQKYNRQDWISESIRQVLLHIKYLYDKETGLFYHGWSFELNSNFGGVFWGRGNSWFTFGLIDYIESFNGTMDEGLKVYLADTFKAQVNALVKLQSPSGLWHTILMDPTSYEEVSGTAGIAAGILKGIQMGILDESYKKYADKAIKAICDNIDEEGTVLNVSAGTSMGYNAQHYKDIIVAPMAYGQSLALIALCAAL